MKVNVYIDGFNLYYAIKSYDRQGVNYRWLDLEQLARVLLPGHTIKRVRYFTAAVDGRRDPYSPMRQQIYWRALRTSEIVTIHQGQFLSNTIRMPLAHPSPDGPTTVEVVRTEEKGSDVNIATYMLFDCFKNEFEMAALISNDTDLIEPMRIIRTEFGCSVGVFNPQQRYSSAMKKAASFYTRIEERHLKASQFPNSLHDSNGPITRPTHWQ